MEHSVTAPAKINLTLDVMPPRGDGYHDLDSVVLVVEPSDRLTIAVVRGGSDRTEPIALTCSDSTLPCDDNNLAVRAARLFREEFAPDTYSYVCLDLEKRLPSQAGLGGGSSDAAAVLRILNRLFPVPAGRLRVVAAAVGSDVPLFLEDAPAVRMRGRGERVEALPDGYFPAIYGVLVRPEVGVPTGPAYAALDTLPDRTPGESTDRLWEALMDGKVRGADTLAPLLHNDFEAVVLPNYPLVDAAHRGVGEAGALRALLCGSGSAVFGLAHDENHAQALAAKLQGHFPFVAVAQPYRRKEQL